MALRPSSVELRAMLCDLQARLGPKEAAQALSATPVVWRNWITGRVPPTASASKLVWWLWVTVCRPGSIKTLWDIITFGRFTEFGGPEHAGKPPIRPLARLIDGDEYPRKLSERRVA